MPPHLIITSLAFAAQFGFLAFGFWPRRMGSRAFYKLSAVLMLFVTGAWIGAGSWNAVWSGALALAWVWAEATEPRRQARREAVERLWAAEGTRQ